MKYCLKPQAKEQLTERFIVAGLILTIILATLGFVWFLMWGIFGYPPTESPTIIDYFLVTIGYFTWAFFIYYIGYSVYHWFKNNIIECKELE